MGLIKDATSEEALSKLQQGIQGVTEDTAGAIEAYMNIVAQRVFEQNMYLQEIRDHLNNFDLDVQLGTLSQMLLQLQQSYQVQQNIESILTGVLNPSGRAIVVELNS
jgi:chemotaxis protein histidine kinase CheA